MIARRACELARFLGRIINRRRLAEPTENRRAAFAVLIAWGVDPRITDVRHDPQPNRCSSSCRVANSFKKPSNSIGAPQPGCLPNTMILRRFNTPVGTATLFRSSSGRAGAPRGRRPPGCSAPPIRAGSRPSDAWLGQDAPESPPDLGSFIGVADFVRARVGPSGCFASPSSAGRFGAARNAEADAGVARIRFGFTQS